MSAYAQNAGLKLFTKHIEQYAPADPLYETYTDSRGRQKRRKREIPPGLSSHDAQILRSVNKRAHYLDKGINLCGFRFGWSFFVGAFPGAGDVVNAGLNYYLVIRKARQADLPDWLVTRMLVNMAISAVIGLVPVIGDISIAVYKANSRNAALLEEYLRIRGEEYLKVQQRRMQNEQEQGKIPGETVPGESVPRKRKGLWSRNSKKDAVEGDASGSSSGQETSGKPTKSRGLWKFGSKKSNGKETASEGETLKKQDVVENVDEA